METWRILAVKAAFEALSRPVIDGTPEGEDWIRENVIRPVWGETKAKAYRNGKQSWCGDFLAYCWRTAGFRVPAALSSVGRLLFPFGMYLHKAKAGPHWCVVLGPGGEREAKLVEDVHDQAAEAGQADAQRVVRRLGEDGLFRLAVASWTPRPGDAFCWQDSPNGWNGHVMMVLAKSGDNLTVVDGNGLGSFGPTSDGRASGRTWIRRDGVGMRTLHLPTMGPGDRPCWLVRPSVLDFGDAILSYHPSLAAAEKAAKE